MERIQWSRLWYPLVALFLAALSLAVVALGGSSK